MKTKIVKVQDGQWDVLVDGKVVTTATRSYKFDGSYEAKLENGKTIYAVNQSALKRMVEKYL